jgi:hypothetical protein
MNELKEFQAVLQIIVSRLVQMIAKEMNISDKEALSRLYISKLYEKLEKEETKVWPYTSYFHLQYLHHLQVHR